MQRKGMAGAVLGSALLLSLVACGGVGGQPPPAMPSPVASSSVDYDQLVAAALGARGQVLESDVEVIGDLGTYANRWNTAAEPLLRDYADASISAKEWVTRSRSQLADLKVVVDDLNERVGVVDDPDLQAYLQKFADNYERWLGSLTAIRSAVVAGDPKAEARAKAGLEKDANRGIALADDMLARIRAAVPAEVLSKYGLS